MTKPARVRFVAAGEHYREAAARLEAEVAGGPGLAAAIEEGRKQLARQEAAFRRFLRSQEL